MSKKKANANQLELAVSEAVVYTPSSKLATVKPAAVMDGSATVAKHLRHLATEPQETFVSLALNARNQVIEETEIARGTLTNCPVHPREVFRALIRANAAACILAHNHPSGNPEPSPDDLSLTRRLVRAGALLGIPVLDHVIIGTGGHVSLAERGVIA